MNRVRLPLILVACALVWGCGAAGSAIQGKLVDGRGRPLSGIELIARQKAPVKGYDGLKTRTRSDGTFRFKHLLPASRYSISPVSPSLGTSASFAMEAPPAGETMTLPASLTVRFTSSGNGVIKDSRTGLEWLPAPQSTSMNWLDAVRYAESLSVSMGGKWRLPTREELRGLYDESQQGHADALFRIDCNWVWTSEAKDETDAWFFNFENRYEDGHCKEWLLTRGRVLVVRQG